MSSPNFMRITLQNFMDAHNPAYDTKYRVDADSGRVDDSLGQCPNTVNPDQLDSGDDGIDNVCELPPGC
jgi:hypothetical protein